MVFVPHRRHTYGLLRELLFFLYVDDVSTSQETHLWTVTVSLLLILLAVQPFIGYWLRFLLLIPVQNWNEALDGGNSLSQDLYLHRTRQNVYTDTHPLSGIGTHERRRWKGPCAVGAASEPLSEPPIYLSTDLPIHPGVAASVTYPHDDECCLLGFYAV
jgi:hypothetical protein